MDHLYFKSLFRKFSGYIYQYQDPVPDDVDTKEYIIEQFVSIAGMVGLEISVTQLVSGDFVLHSYENINPGKFIQLCNLSADPPAPEPTPEPIPEPEPTPEGEE